MIDLVDLIYLFGGGDGGSNGNGNGNGNGGVFVYCLGVFGYVMMLLLNVDYGFLMFGRLYECVGDFYNVEK